MDLFDYARDRHLAGKAPLAARMRPRTLEEFAGQTQILGPGRLLRRAIQADQLSSLIFFGPPGTGKTTLARIIANSTKAHFTALNAVLAGVADLRQAVAEAEARLGQHGQRTILFVDEVHRFNKAQQDALLPHVENGTVVLIGATTENPYFEVNKALVSRSRIFELKPLEEADLLALLQRALQDPGRGFGKLQVRAEPEALAHLARVANGDARAALNALELAVETTSPGADGAIALDLAVAEESIQRKAVLYDKDGDAHFDTISAFIKSLRGSDADAALYWMARMVYAGEDPRFILRRMLIFAAEDVGLADPEALRVVAGAAQAFDYVGLPEGRFHLAQACLYLATAPKSNSAFAFFDALAAVEREQAGDVPNPLKDGNRDAEGLGHGQGYQYPHAYQDHWVAQQYLPDNLKGRVFYEPTLQGREAALRERVLRLREAQLAAALEPPEEAPPGFGPLEAPSPGIAPPGLDQPGLNAPSGPAPTASGAARAEWVQRSQGHLAQHLTELRERLLVLARLERQHLVLDAQAGSGLLLWELLRRITQGGVWARAANEAEARALAQQAQQWAPLSRPVILWGELQALPQAIAAELVRQAGISPGHAGSNAGPHSGNGRGSSPDHRGGPDSIGAAGGPGAAPPPLRFDRILARGVLAGAPEGQVALLAALLAPGGSLVLAQPLPSLGERFFAALARAALPAPLAERLVEAEEALFADAAQPDLRWTPGDVAAWCSAAGLRVRGQERLQHATEVTLTAPLLARWLGAAQGPSAPPPPDSPAVPPSRLAAALGAQAADIRQHLERHALGLRVPRQQGLLLVEAQREA